MDHKNSRNTLLQPNQDSKQALRQSLQKIRIAYQKLMILQVFTSKINILTNMSQQANKLSKRVLGTHINAVHNHPSSNVRAFSFVLILALSQNGANLQTKQSINNIVNKLKQNPLKIKNYILSNKFTGSDMLQIFAAMQLKLLQLVEGGLQIHDILKAYSSYLDLGTYFLRSILADIKYQNSDDFNQKLSTNQIYSILSQYLDLSYIINKNIYLFPDLKVFIATPDDQEFIFGRYYDNFEQLQKFQSDIRESTIQYVNQMNKKNEANKFSNINFQASMSDLTQSKFTDTQVIPVSSKALTPQFGQNTIKYFQQLLEYNSQQGEAKNLLKYNQNQVNNVKIQNNYGDNIQKQKQIQPQQNKNFFQQQLLSPAMTIPNKKGFGSAFYLHQFDFIHYSSPQRNFLFQKMCSQRVLMKGSSMVDQGKVFLNQINQMKKKKQNQIVQRDTGRKYSKKHKQETISAHTLIHSNQIAKYGSPLSKNVKSQKGYDNRSSSNLSVNKKKNLIKLQSRVYHLSIPKNPQQINIDKKRVSLNKSGSSRSKGKSNLQNRLKQSEKQLKNIRTEPDFKFVFQVTKNFNKYQRKKHHIMPRQSQLPYTSNGVNNYQSIKIPIKKYEYQKNNQIYQNSQQQIYYQDSFAKKKDKLHNYTICDGQNVNSTFQHISSQIPSQGQNNINSYQQKNQIKIQETKIKPLSKQKVLEQPRKYHRIGQISRKILSKKQKEKQINNQEKIIIPHLNGNNTLLSFGGNNKNVCQQKIEINPHHNNIFVEMISQFSKNKQKTLSHSKNKKNHLHIPSFLRKKQKNQKICNNKNTHSGRNSKSRQGKSSKSREQRKQARQKSRKDKQRKYQVSKPLTYSPHSTIKSIQTKSLKNIQMEFHVIKQQKASKPKTKTIINNHVSDSNLLTSTPTFGTPQNTKIIKKKE